MPQPRRELSVGETFGGWTVTALAGTQHRHAAWRCRCECGTVRDVLGTRLRSGRSRSCGCERYEPRDEAERFWEKVNKTSPGGCWLWTSGVNDGGYGTFRVGGRRGSQLLAHRYAWMKLVGPIADDLCVLHRCDMPRCCNPEHLFLGDRETNNRDRDQKGRAVSVRGARHPNAKLDEDGVREIRRLHRSGMTQTKLARQFGVSNACVRQLLVRFTWSHVA